MGKDTVVIMISLPKLQMDLLKNMKMVIFKSETRNYVSK